MLEQGEHSSVQNRVCIRVHSMIRVGSCKLHLEVIWENFVLILCYLHCMVILVILLDLKDRFEKNVGLYLDYV